MQKHGRRLLSRASRCRAGRRRFSYEQRRPRAATPMTIYSFSTTLIGRRRLQVRLQCSRHASHDDDFEIRPMPPTPRTSHRSRHQCRASRGLPRHYDANRISFSATPRVDIAFRKIGAFRLRFVPLAYDSRRHRLRQLTRSMTPQRATATSPLAVNQPRA